MNMRFGILAQAVCVAVALSSLGLVGCGGGDDDSSTPPATTVVVTNTVGGVTRTNIVVVTHAPVGPAAPAEDFAPVAGKWNGPKDTADGAIHYDVNLHQSGDAITGTFTANVSSGNITGTISDWGHLVLHFQYTAGASVGYAESWEGNVNSMADEFLGTWTPNNGATSNTFGLQKG